METTIISLGGSLIIPEGIDIDFLKSFIELVKSEVKKGRRFVIIVGGGKICRRYQEAGIEIKKMNEEELDWLGIYSTRLNAGFVKILFGEIAQENIILDPTLPIEMKKPILIGGGWKPGWSTDYVAVTFAKQLGEKKVINLSNIDYAYDKDPKKFSDAKKLENISWQEYRSLIPKEWNPGLNTPFDPIASELAEKTGIEVAIMNGKPIDNLVKYINGEKFVGTTIK